MCRRLREQARSHGGSRYGSGYVPHHKTLWERGLPAKAVGQAAQMLNVPTPSRASPLPQGLGCKSRYSLHPRTTVGAWLARESGGSGDRDVECADAFASKPAPTGSRYGSGFVLRHKTLWERGLPAKAVGQATEILNVPTPSRASPLPRNLGMDRDMYLTTKHCGSVACPRKRWVRRQRC